MLMCKQQIVADINTLGEQLLEANQPQDAMTLFQMAASREPANGKYVNNLGISCFQAGDLASATRSLLAALQCNHDLRLYTMNYADLTRTTPRLLRSGLQACRDYLELKGQDEEVQAMADLIQQDIEVADQDFLDAVAAMPVHAKLKVNGASEPEHFVKMGENIADNLLEDLDGLREAKTVLDFGVGLGRVLWPLSQKLPAAQFVGFDVDPMMLTNLSPVAEVADTKFVSTTHDIPDNSMDAAYVISVFTHLDHTTEYWLWELNRVLASGGRAYVTYHDETLYDEIRDTPADKRDFTGRTILGGGSEGSTRVATFYETTEWNRIVGHYFKIIRTVPRGLHGHQSYSLLEKCDTTADSLDLHRTYMRDLERELYQMRKQAVLEF